MYRYRLFLEDLASFAFIHALEKNSDIRLLPYSVIEKFGHDVAKTLEEKTGNKAALILSRAHTEDFYSSYSDFFSEDKEGVRLKEGKTIIDLINRFCGVMPVDVLKAFRATEIEQSI